MARILPAATGGAHDRLIRALQRGGMAASGADGVWSIYRDRDKRRRIVGTMDAVAVDALVSTGRLCALGETGRILVWSGPAVTGAAATPVATPLIPGKAKPQPRRTPMEQVLAQLSDERTRLRARNAALRLDGDVHRAATPRSVTMRWDGAGAVDGTRRAGDGAGTSHAAAAAARRIADMRTALGSEHFAALLALVLHERPLNRIAADAGWPARTAAKSLAGLLTSLADAYDQRTRD
ncbi:MAG: DUF6456 domain-containing protein [Pseudomonadota bacterium]